MRRQLRRMGARSMARRPGATGPHPHPVTSRPAHRWVGRRHPPDRRHRGGRRPPRRRRRQRPARGLAVRVRPVAARRPSRSARRSTRRPARWRRAPARTGSWRATRSPIRSRCRGPRRIPSSSRSAAPEAGSPRSSRLRSTAPAVGVSARCGLRRPADDLFEVFGPGEYLMLIYADPALDPIAEGSFILVGAPAASPSASASALRRPGASEGRDKKKGSETCPISDPRWQAGVPIRLVGR